MQLQNSLSFSCSNMKESFSKPVYKKLLEGSEIAAVIKKITALSYNLLARLENQLWLYKLLQLSSPADSVPAALFKMNNRLHGGSDS